MGELSQALKIILEVQKKGIMKKLQEKKKFSNLQNTFFSFFAFSLDPSYFLTS
jgi:hypothetical protein